MKELLSSAVNTDGYLELRWDATSILKLERGDFQDTGDLTVLIGPTL